ncbi:hypothetical protein PMIN03_003738 [Paraphaeosphaeria minitans]
MHAGLIFLVASLAASAVAAPMPIQAPAESPVIREAEADPKASVLDNLKREVLERLETIVLRSIPDEDEEDQTFGPSNDKRRLAYGATKADPNYKRDARFYDHDKVNRRDSSLEASESTYQKRQSAKGYAGRVYDKRDVSTGYDPSANDRRYVSTGYNPSANDKREPEALEYVGPSADYKRNLDLHSENENESDNDLAPATPNYRRGRDWVGSSMNYKREPEARQYFGPSANYKREAEARQYIGPSANYKREPEARQYIGPSANYKREAEAREYIGPSANYKREPEARQYIGPSANYRRDSDEADIYEE